MAKFLIVDDSPVERFTLRKCLEKLGHEVICEAKNGTEALDYYKSSNPDVVVLDIVMPDENGIDVLNKIINYDNNAKIIMCTSSATSDFVRITRKLGAKHFLVKPIDILSLNNILNSLQLTGSIAN